MATIDIRRKHGQTPEKARALVDKTAASMAKKIGLQTEWDDDTLRFTRSGVNGEIRVTKTEVIVHAKLGLLLGAMKPMIEREINAQLDKHFA